MEGIAALVSSALFCIMLPFMGNLLCRVSRLEGKLDILLRFNGIDPDKEEPNGKGKLTKCQS